MSEFTQLVENIVKEAKRLKDKHTKEIDASVNYACIFCQNDDEYKTFKQLAGELGSVLEQTKSGPLFRIKIETVAGTLQLLKVRNPDITRKERGDADFTVDDYSNFKTDYIGVRGFKVMTNKDFEMIELMDPDFDVRAYFSNPPLDQQMGLI